MGYFQRQAFCPKLERVCHSVWSRIEARWGTVVRAFKYHFYPALRWIDTHSLLLPPIQVYSTTMYPMLCK